MSLQIALFTCEKQISSANHHQVNGKDKIIKRPSFIDLHN